MASLGYTVHQSFKASLTNRIHLFYHVALTTGGHTSQSSESELFNTANCLTRSALLPDPVRVLDLSHQSTSFIGYRLSVE